MYGFTFDGNNSALNLITVAGAGATSAKPFKNLVVGNCKLKNTGTVTSGSGAISSTGQIRGVIYGNTFDRCNVILKILATISKLNGRIPHIIRSLTVARITSSLRTTPLCFHPHSAELTPVENGAGTGSRLVVRYNSWNMANASQQELWDIHGFQYMPGGQTGTMISEYYGNTATNCTGYRWINHRGSWGLFFNNVG